MSAALDTVDELANCGFVSEETAFDAHNLFADAFRDVLASKALALVVDDCTKNGIPTEYSVYIFDNEDDCKYFLDGILSECRIITVDELVELSPIDWYNLNKYKTVDGVTVFHDFTD
ncbi:MAG: hypothetical protein NC299_18400 [Lachnospiraceae bacterium]|nr:hypothetical protein [Ruminococcus sp.]MCM1277299.1 hypothetical protein [Lachnospiraceae bacterium]